MMTQHAAPLMEAVDAEPSATVSQVDGGPKDNRRRVARARMARVVLAFGVAASLAAGGWGIFSTLGVEADPARVGEPVEVRGGLVRVDGVTPESMAPMQADKFAASGMSMSSMGMDMAPEGQRRFTVDVALAAEDGTVSYSPEDFRITGEGMEETGPIRDALEGETVSVGGAVAGNLVFQVPEAAKDIELSFDGARQIALDLPPATKAVGQEKDGANEDGHDH